MAKRVINVGVSTNDGKGDSLRVGAQKINDNFTELYTALGANTGSLSIVSALTGGSGITVSSRAGDVTISSKIASETTLGGIKVGDNLSITEDGVLNANTGSYTLPVAQAGTLGGVKIGSGITISPTGVISTQVYTLPTASSDTLGGVKIGARLTITDGVLSANVQSYSLPKATDHSLGGVIVDGSTITINPNGVISAPTSSVSIGDITFDGINIIGVPTGPYPGLIQLTPYNDSSYLNNGQYLNIYPTTGQDAPHIHIAAGNGGESRGDLILGDDNQYVNINHQGQITIQSQDAMRGWTNGWTFDTDGTLNSGGTLYVNGNIEAQYGHSLGLSGSYVTRATQTVQFSNADGTARTVYTVDGNAYSLTGINLSNVMQIVVYDNGTQYTLSTSNITYDSGTHVWTFTFNTAITLQSATTYTVDWFIWAPQGVQLNGGENSWFFSPDGSVRFPQWAMQRDSGNVVCNANADTVVFTSYDTNLHTIKLLIKVEGSLSGTTWDTQSCEMIIAKSWRANTVVASVYAVVHTSPDPLATFTAQWNNTAGKVEVMCRPTSSTYGVEVKTFATEITSSD